MCTRPSAGPKAGWSRGSRRRGAGPTDSEEGREGAWETQERSTGTRRWRRPQAGRERNMARDRNPEGKKEGNAERGREGTCARPLPLSGLTERGGGESPIVFSPPFWILTGKIICCFDPPFTSTKPAPIYTQQPGATTLQRWRRMQGTGKSLSAPPHQPVHHRTESEHPLHRVGAPPGQRRGSGWMCRKKKPETPSSALQPWKPHTVWKSLWRRPEAPEP